MARDGESGFSLLEAVVAFAILSLALTSMFGAGIDALRGTRKAEERTAALLEARSLIDRVGADLPLERGAFTGTTALGRPYSIEITPLVFSKTALVRTFRVEATVGAQPNGLPIVSLETLRAARPEQ